MAQDVLRRLSDHLALAEGFSLHILLCPARRELDELLGGLAGQAALEGRGPQPLLRLDPEAGLAPGPGAPDKEALARTILEPLLDPARRLDAPGTIYALDGTLAHRCEDEAWCRLLGHTVEGGAWAWLFGRMNELRNRIAAALPGPLLVCLSPAMEVVLASSAPDFWSIRSAHHLLEAFARPLPPPRAGRLGELVSEALGRIVWDQDAARAIGLPGAMVAAREGRWDSVRAWLDSTTRSHPRSDASFAGMTGSPWLPETPSFRVGTSLVAFLLDSLDVGWSAVRDRLGSMKADLIGKAEGSEAFPLGDQWLTLASWAEQCGDADEAAKSYQEAFGSYWGHWAGGTSTWTEPRMVDAALGCFRALAAQSRPDLGLPWLRSAEAVLGRAPWPDWVTQRELPPNAEDYHRLAAAYASLGDERRARYYRARATEQTMTASPSSSP